MPQIAVPVIIGAVQGGIAAAPAGGLSIPAGLLLGGALGAGVGALGLITQQKPGTRRGVDDQVVTTSARNLPVPILFGRSRVGGSIVALGNAWTLGTHATDQGANVFELHMVLALCEGPIQFAGNRIIDGKLEKNFSDTDNVIADVSDAEEEPFKIRPSGLTHQDLYIFTLYGGTNSAEVPPMLLDVGTQLTTGFTQEVDGVRVNITSGNPPVPWRNTAIYAAQCYVGYTPHLPQISSDVVGPDYTIRRSGSTSGTNFGDVAGYAYYDGHEECFWHTIASSGTESAPFGVVKLSRTGDSGRQHTPPPTAVTTSIEQAWYLARHDILVMQDPVDTSKFWIGYWGISRGSADWQAFTPHSGYESSMAAEYLDELHGYLHTIHEAGDSSMFVLRWNLLSGDVEKLETDLPTGPYLGFLYSPDLDAYVVATSAGHVFIVTADTGETIRDSTAANLSGCIGICVSGARIGIIKTDSFIYLDPTSDDLIVYGSSDTSLDAGHLGGTVSARQNSWTGHVTLTKPFSGTAAFVNFIPSVVEDLQDVSALGSPKGVEFQWDYDIAADGTATLLRTMSSVSDWTRDWSYRTYNEYSLVALQGLSSVTAAMWALCVDEPSLDSIRYGAGRPAKYFSLSSFESVHAYCVGGVLMQNVRKRKDVHLASSASYRINVTGSAPGGCCWDSGDLGSQVLTMATPPDGWTNAWANDHWILYGAPGEWKLKFKCGGGPVFTNVGPDTPTDGTWTNVGITGCSGGDLTLHSVTVEDGSSGLTGGGLYPLSYRWAERYKFDYLVDSETSAAALFSEEMLVAINGFRRVIGGKLHIGIHRPGVLASWFFNEERIGVGSASVAFQGRSGGMNRVRVQYTNVRGDDYRKDFAEANDEYDQNARGRVYAQTLNCNGIGRNGHADIIAKSVLDLTQASRRAFNWKLGYLGLAFVAGDAVKISHAGCGIVDMKARITSLQEDQASSFKLAAIEQRPVLSILRDADTGDPNDPVVDPPNDPTDPGNCESAIGSTGSGVVWFDDGGTYSAGTYYLYYIRGAYMLSPGGGFAVEGYDLVTQNQDGEIVVVAEAPAVANPAEGFDTAGEAEEANTGQFSTIVLATPGPLGLRLRQPPKYTNFSGTGNPLYDLCRQKNQCENCPDDCDENCSECANCGDCWYSKSAVLVVDYAVRMNGLTPLLPTERHLELPLVSIDEDKLRFLLDIAGTGDGEYAEAILECATGKLLLKHIKGDSTDGAWYFAGVIKCDGGEITLDPELSVWLEKAGSDDVPEGSATVKIANNLNDDGSDCKKATGCGHNCCSFNLVANGGSEGFERTLDLSTVWDDRGLEDDDIVTFQVMWDSDEIPDKLTVTDGESVVRILTPCVGTNLTAPPDGQTFYYLDLTKAQAAALTIKVDANCDPLNTGPTGWHIRISCKFPRCCLCGVGCTSDPDTEEECVAAGGDWHPHGCRTADCEPDCGGLCPTGASLRWTEGAPSVTTLWSDWPVKWFSTGGARNGTTTPVEDIPAGRYQIRRVQGAVKFNPGFKRSDVDADHTWGVNLGLDGGLPYNNWVVRVPDDPSATIPTFVMETPGPGTGPHTGYPDGFASQGDVDAYCATIDGQAECVVEFDWAGGPLGVMMIMPASEALSNTIDITEPQWCLFPVTP